MADHAGSAAAQFERLGIKRKVPIEAAAPKCPPALSYLWSYFCELSLGLASNGMGPPVASWVDLQAWCGFSGVALQPWEARALVMLGQIRAGVESEEPRKINGGDGQG